MHLTIPYGEIPEGDVWDCCLARSGTFGQTGRGLLHTNAAEGGRGSVGGGGAPLGRGIKGGRKKGGGAHVNTQAKAYYEEANTNYIISTSFCLHQLSLYQHPTSFLTASLFPSPPEPPSRSSSPSPSPSQPWSP